MNPQVFRYRFTVGQQITYALQMRVTVQVESQQSDSGSKGPITQVAEVRGRLTLTVDAIDGDRARITTAAEKLDGEVPSQGLFDAAAIGDPLAALPGVFTVGPRGEARHDGGEGSAVDVLFPALPDGPVRPEQVWVLSPEGAEVSADEPGAVHCRYIGREADEDDGVVRPIVGVFSGHAWNANQGPDGAGVAGETRRMSEIQMRPDTGWAHRVDAQVKTHLTLGAPEVGEAAGQSRSVDTFVELLLLEVA